MKTISITIYLLFKHYLGGGTKAIAYESALMTATFFVLIHLLQVKVLLWGGGLTFGVSKLQKLLSISVVFIPTYFILMKIFSKKTISNIPTKYSINYKRGYLYLILYCLLTFGILTLLILISKDLIL